MMMEIIKVRNKFEMQEIPDRTALSVMEMGDGSEERAARCAQMRGFKAAVAKAEHRKEVVYSICEGIITTVFGGGFIALILAALWLANAL